MKFPTFVKTQKRMKTIFVKNMVCNRCILVVKNTLDSLGIASTQVKLGEIILDSDSDTLPTPTQLQALNNSLEELGFEIIDDKKSQTIEKIKNTIIALVHQQDNNSKINLSDLLSMQLQLDYNYLSSLFSEVEGQTIEKYFIAQKIEKVKELLVYDELSLTEIADRLNYSSVAYLSNQFKKVTGLSPSHFKRIRSDKRKPLDQVS